MRALRYDAFGPPDVLRIADVAEPSPAAGEVKVRVHAAGLNPLDWKVRTGHLRYLPVLDRPPRGIGVEFAGEIVGVGGGTMGRFPGQRVFGSLVPFRRQGAVAEYVCANIAHIATIPDAITFQQAAALPIAGGTALQALVDHAHLAPGQRVLITAAAGGVGHYAVQLAKHLGANVTAVCGPANVDFVRTLGADAVVDYTHEDFTRRDERFDVVFDAAGGTGYFASRAVLAPAGVFVDTSPSAAAVVKSVLAHVVTGVSGGQRAIGLVLRADGAMWERLATLAADGVLVPHLARVIALEDVADAQRAMETGHGRGKIVVDLMAPARR
ncbi:MAG: NAD(P)-dependent alcohol dehydrogenase [Betaproteobacteria bacterium]